MPGARDRLPGTGDDATCAILKLLLAPDDPRGQRAGLAAVTSAALPIAVFEGREHRLRLVNRAWQAQVGVGGAVGEPLRDRGLLGWLARVFDAGEPAPFAELALPTERPAGALERCYSGVITPVRTPGGLGSVLVTCAEVTDDVLGRRLLAEPGALIWSGTAPDRCDHVHRGWIAYTGSLATNDEGVIHTGDLARCAAIRAEVIAGRDGSEIDVRIRRADDSFRWHRVRFVADRSARGPARWFGVAVDHHEAHELAVELARSQEREAEAVADARRATRRKNLFLASASHELRAPITTMLLWEKVMRDDPTDPELRLRALDAIRQSAMTQNQLVADLLDVARSASNKFHVELRPVEIGQILVEAIDAAEPIAAARQQRLVRHLDDELGQVRGDRHRLRQIFDNLLANAVKFTEPHGRIGVSARIDAEHVVIEVSDTGRGITPEFLPHVFEPFSQAEDPMTRSGGGLGLGLAISHQLASSHGGTLTADSLGEDRGATFTVTLPVAKREPSPARTPPPAPRLGGLQLLVIDDDARVRDALQLLLERSGAVVATAESAAAGRGAMARTLPDVVLSDLAMPGEDGYSFVRQMRAASATRSVPAVAITAHVTDGDRQRAIAAGFDQYFTKPLNIDQLISAIAVLVQSRRARAE